MKIWILGLVAGVSVVTLAACGTHGPSSAGTGGQQNTSTGTGGKHSASSTGTGGAGSSSSATGSGGAGGSGGSGGASSSTSSSATAGTGGGTNALFGTWKGVATATGGGTTSKEDVGFTFNSDGTAVFEIDGPDGETCTGAVKFSGFTWTSTAADLTVAGTATCSGKVTCTTGTTTSIDCTEPQNPDGTCTYALTNSNNTLTLDCSQADTVVLQRQ